MVSLPAAGKVPDKTALYVVPLTFDVDPKLIPDGKEDPVFRAIVVALSAVTSTFAE